jgi:hypothetical protein
MPSEVKSTKFVKQILSTYKTIVVISRFAKQYAEGSQKEKVARSFFFNQIITKFYVQNGKVGKGDVFSPTKMSLLPYLHTKFRTKIEYLLQSKSECKLDDVPGVATIVFYKCH